jgi:hypothetical protein
MNDLTPDCNMAKDTLIAFPPDRPLEAELALAVTAALLVAVPPSSTEFAAAGGSGISCVGSYTGISVQCIIIHTAQFIVKMMLECPQLCFISETKT